MSSTGSTQTTYRDCRDRLEDAVKTLLIERIAKEHADDVSRKATSAISFEDSACFLQRTMAALNHIALNQSSVLIKEEAVNITFRKQKNYICMYDQNIAEMVNNTHMYVHAENLLNGICNTRMSSSNNTEAVCMDSMDRLEDAVRKSLVEKIAQDYFVETCMYVHLSFSFQSTLSNYLEGDAGSTEAACRNCMVRLEDAFRKPLVEKIAQDYFVETYGMYVHLSFSFQSTFSNDLEEADRLSQETMNTLHHHTSGLVNEETVNNALQEQTNMDKNTVDGQDEITPYLAIELTGPILLHLTQDFHLASRVSMSTRMPTRSNYHLRNSSITFECSTKYMDTERHMSATVLETVLVDQDSFETVNNGALIINQSKLIKSRILHLLHDMCCGKTVRDESLTKHACSVIEGGKLKVQRDCLTNSHFNVSVSQTRTSTCLSHKHKPQRVCLTNTNSC